jgi:hypothetical protein
MFHIENHENEKSPNRVPSLLKRGWGEAVVILLKP